MKIANLTLGPETTRVGEFSYLALVGLQPLMIALNGPPGGGRYWHIHVWAISLGVCRCEGYGFQAVYSSIGYINQSVSV